MDGGARRNASLRMVPSRQVPEDRPKPRAAARAGTAKPGAKRRQGRAKRMPRQGGLRVGVGGAVQSSRTTHPTQDPPPKHPRQHKPHGATRHPPPHPPAAARARRAKPGANGAGKAEQSARRAREDYGWGWAGRFNQAVPPTPPKTRPPNTRGSTSRTAPPATHLPIHPRQREPAGRSPAPKAPARRRKAPAAPGRITGGGGRGGVTKTDADTGADTGTDADTGTGTDTGTGADTRADPKTPAAARARRAKPGANAPARRSKANAAPGRITGGGGRGGAIKPYHPSHPRPAPLTPAAARAGTAKPGAKRRQGRAKRMPRQGGLRVGVGGAVQSNRTTQPTQHPTPPNTRGSTSRTAPPRPSNPRIPFRRAPVCLAVAGGVRRFDPIGCIG